MFFGVDDAGRIPGMEVTTSTVDSVVRELRKIEPLPALNPERVRLENGREVIAVSVPGRTGGPYTYEGRPYIREGSSTTVMPQEPYRRLLLERTHPAQRWELLPAHGVTLADLDAIEITRTIDEAVRRMRLDEPGTRDPEALLSGLKLIQNGQLLNAAVVLFGKSDRLLPCYPQCVLRMARFRGVDKTEFIDGRHETGNAFELLQRAQRFPRDHLPVAGRVVPSLFEREDDPMYPPVALREALVNALSHRDYGMPGGSVAIAIYDDRLEITNTGQLPFGLTPADLKRPHTSLPWNPLIASVFLRRGIAESWGRGTLKIVELSAGAGLVEPEFEERGGEVVVRFLPIGYVPPSRVSRSLTDLQQNVLEVLAAEGPLRLGQINARLRTPANTYVLKDNLQMLRRLDLIELSGKTRAALWALKGGRTPNHP
ncbi:MAG TPA: ATP-binding protein [Longimicrobium sp.]|nr:ATP-binding protein [Longimicrobium sp.]